VVAGTVIVSLALGLLLRRGVDRWLAAWARRSETPIDDAVAASLRRPIPWWCLLLGVHVATHLVALPQSISQLVSQLLLSVLIITVTLWLAGLGVRLLVFAAERRADGPLPATGVAKNVLRIVIIVLGAVVLLGTLGVSIAPILTTIGIGGLAVALGLQETLSNLFAGMHVTLARNVRVGDFIRLETGEEGTIEDIGWRATRVRLLPNNVVLIPNGRLAQSVVTNYDLPSRDLAVLLPLGVHYASDLAHVERVTCEVARGVMKDVPEGVADFEPFIRFHTFGASSIDFTLIARARSFQDSYLVKHELVKRIHARYAQEGIVIPFPIRALNLEQERADREVPALQ
jgi:small-conductance mechanosensitive channel